MREVKRLAIWAGLFVALGLTGCSPVHRRTIAEAPSPNGGLVASVVEVNGGATVPYAYSITLSRADHGRSGVEEVAFLYKVHNRNNRDRPMLTWRGNTTLEISFRKARVQSYTNYYWVGERPEGQVYVEIRLVHPPADFIP